MTFILFSFAFLHYFFFKYNLKEPIDEVAEWLRQLTAKGANKNNVTT